MNQVHLKRCTEFRDQKAHLIYCFCLKTHNITVAIFFYALITESPTNILRTVDDEILGGKSCENNNPINSMKKMLKKIVERTELAVTLHTS